MSDGIWYNKDLRSLIQIGGMISSKIRYDKTNY